MSQYVASIYYSSISYSETIYNNTFFTNTLFIKKEESTDEHILKYTFFSRITSIRTTKFQEKLSKNPPISDMDVSEVVGEEGSSQVLPCRRLYRRPKSNASPIINAGLITPCAGVMPCAGVIRCADLYLSLMRRIETENTSFHGSKTN